MVSLFDLEEHPENLAVIVFVAAGVLFFLCVYCSFIRPVVNCVFHIFSILSRIICCNRSSDYSSVGQG